MNTKFLGTLIFASSFLFIGEVHAQWTEPTLAPPNGNVLAPLRLDTNGRLGIGTASAGYLVDLSASAANTLVGFINLDGRANSPDHRLSVGSDGSHNGSFLNTIVYGRGTGSLDYRLENSNWAGFFSWAVSSQSGSPSTYKVISDLSSAGSGATGNSHIGRFRLFSASDAQGGYSLGGGAGTVGVQLVASGSSWLNGGNVGIGTASPAHRLDVAGDINVTGCYRVAGTCIGAGSLAGSGTTNFIPKFTAASTLGNSQLFDNGTNVGVGISAPTEKLHVDGRVMVAGSGGYTLNPANPVFGRYTSTIGYVQAPSGGNIQIWKDDTSSIAHFGENGRVGIGTVSPTQVLTVNGLINKEGGWIAGNANWGQDSFEIHTPAWDGVSNTNYGTIAAGKIYAYRGLQSGGGTGAEATDGELYVAGRSMLMGPVGIGTTDTTNFAVNVVSDRATSVNVTNSYTTSGIAISGNSQYGASGKGVQGSSGDGYGVYGTSNYGWGIYCNSNGPALCGGNRGWTNTQSDIRLKENVIAIPDSLQKLLKIRGVTYEYKNDPTDKKFAGFIANEIHEVLPEATGINPDTGYYTVNEAQVGALLVEAMKELKAENDDLRARLERLEAKVK